MKIAFAFLILLSSQMSFAQACNGEAQIVSGLVSSVTPTIRGTCKVEINSIFEFRSNSICPIYLDEVYNEGIETKSCHYRVGDELSGFIIRNSAERIVLD